MKMFNLTKYVLCRFRTVNKCCHVQATRQASTYEGDGKTNAQVLNKDLECLMVSAYSSIGFRLNSGVRLIGPLIVFPRTFVSWNISGIQDVHAKSLSIFNILCPKLDILVLGYGDSNSLPRNVELDVIEFCKTNNIGVEVLTTEKAVATFNYLNYEKRYVAGAFIPPKKVKIYDDGDYDGYILRQKTLNESE